jgi:putative hydrolase
MDMVAQVAPQQPTQPLSNAIIAQALAEMAVLLEAQAANPFRIHAYRSAAQVIQAYDEPVAELLEREGFAGLEQLPGIGESLAHHIEELVCTGKLRMLERLRGELLGEDPLASLPGIGPQLADRIRTQLGIESLEDLEAAAYDGRLAAVPGVGMKRVRAVRDVLAGRLGRKVPAAKGPPPQPSDPSVSELLDIDREYRVLAEKGRLPLAAPKRFNPTGAAWLPILHTERGSRRYMVLYSNSAQAHEIGTVYNWVVILREDEEGSGQWTVITSRYGRTKGLRIVRGREAECRDCYDQMVVQRELPFEAAVT